MLNYTQAKHDIITLKRQYNDNNSERHLFTTMFDFYALPDDFPHFSESANIPDIKERVSIIEKEFAKDIAFDTFIPYIQLHEFETLLFVDITKLEIEYPISKHQIQKLKEETDKYRDPELINNSPATAPSKRIIKALEQNYNYNKVQSGSKITALIGLESLFERCQHFRNWIEQIIRFAKEQ